MGELPLYGRQGSKKISEVGLTPEEQGTLEVIKSANATIRQGPMPIPVIIEVPVDKTEAVYALLQKLRKNDVLGTDLGAFSPPQAGATVDAYQIPIADYSALMGKSIDVLMKTLPKIQDHGERPKRGGRGA